MKIIKIVLFVVIILVGLYIAYEHGVNSTKTQVSTDSTTIKCDSIKVDTCIKPKVVVDSTKKDTVKVKK